MVVDSFALDSVTAEMLEALSELPTAERAAQCDKLLAVIDTYPEHIFVTKLKLSPTGPTHHVERMVLHPSRLYLDIAAAVRAGKLDWNIVESAGGLPACHCGAPVQNVVTRPGPQPL